MIGITWPEESAQYLAIALALAAGLAASYGRELEASRRPDKGWWVRRLLIMPLLAVAATAGTEFLDLSATTAAFTAAMLSLGGYDALCLLEIKWREALRSITGTKAHESGDHDELPPRE
jgi:hypothetical protein